MIEGSSALKLSRNPARNRDREPFQKVHNNITKKTRNLVEKQSPLMKIVHNNFKNPESNQQGFLSKVKKSEKKIPEKYQLNSVRSSLHLTNKKEKLEYNFFEKILRKNTNKVIDVTERGLNFGKRMFINPYLQVLSNNLEFVLFRRSIETNKETAYYTGDLLTPKMPFGHFNATHYPRVWIDQILKLTGIPQKSFDFRQKTTVPFINTIQYRLGNLSRKMKKVFYSKESYKKSLARQAENKKSRQKKIKRLNKIKRRIFSPIRLRRFAENQPDESKIINFKPKKKYREFDTAA